MVEAVNETVLALGTFETLVVSFVGFLIGWYAYRTFVMKKKE